MKSSDLDYLMRAWQWREKAGMLQSDAVRVFHGPAEASGPLSSIAIDRFTEKRTQESTAPQEFRESFRKPKDSSLARRDHYWVTHWESLSSHDSASTPHLFETVVKFLEGQGAVSVAGLSRKQKGLPSHPQTHFGSAPSEKFLVNEGGLDFFISMGDSLHPGLFLDHQPLRAWLACHCVGQAVLNAFAYTGSLSVAAAAGGAREITTLDLSKPSLRWAELNLNQNKVAQSKILAGDVFEWFPRFKKNGTRFDCVILDPPSFSRTKKGSFATASDLTRLHQMALDVLSRDGYLITSINSAQVSWKKYEQEVQKAMGLQKMMLIHRIDLPPTFPTPFGDDPSRYLKGWILKRI